ncbi:O-succinylhomoserine sulfhydrylase [Nitrosomonas oligotropha]|uniref:O-succinylhomoserine sulfhydrylase n=1 Tax=Nitrosomonas oligotropha TaxID=42354 RepID=A0A1H8RYH4_9PROT|nr:O-succinylhomoserine sulfhydrylase [Nitrosomonas oligotropha]SDW99435.1 O-succinylhomoserine sulfhydrylase [Nitrosomonas oligotropha]SEO71420.1 O-succinylhomoserine sulfhydrylase [Nitrosomonas oligotropha]
MSDHLQPETLALHTGVHRSQFNEHSEAMYLTSSFVFESAAQAAARFSGNEPGNIYSRFTNPTVTAFEERLAALEGAEACIATSSGMSAILACTMGLLSAGDHIVASRSLFGATVNLFNNILKRFNIDTTFVSATDVQSWQAAIQPNTKLFFLETPSNPLTEISDITELSKIAKKAGIWLAVDNCFCTPILQKPLELGADIVIHSATKYLDGQGRVLGGAVLGKRELLMDGGIYGFLRTAGPTLSAFNAWVILKGLETLKLRIEAHSSNALQMAQWLEAQPNVTRVFYPSLASHPQHALAQCQQKSGGGIVTFEVKGGKEAAWRVIDSTRLISITANLGDAKSTLTHPATTTHARISQEARDAAGITDGLLRIAVGLEAVQDLQADLHRGLT